MSSDPRGDQRGERGDNRGERNDNRHNPRQGRVDAGMQEEQALPPPRPALPPLPIPDIKPGRLDPRLVLAAAVRTGMAVAHWRNPGATAKMALQWKPVTQIFPLDAPRRAGFIFAPFYPKEHPTLWLQPGLVVDAEGGIDPAHLDAALRSLRNEGEQVQAANFKEGLMGRLGDLAVPLPPLGPDTRTTSEGEYADAFLKLMGAMQGALVHKVVLGRVLCQSLPNNNALPHLPPAGGGMQFMFARPWMPLWMANTPELLLDMDGPRISTMALAGTRAPGRDFGPKEHAEHDFVVRYIERHLRDAGYHTERDDEHEVTTPLGLIHLRTPIHATWKGETPDMPTWYKMAKLLHPTPAVAGTPKREARQLIQKSEPFSRGYYAGFCGWADDAHHARLYVTLRCMALHQGHAVRYAGGGLTIQSNLRDEWHEAGRKLHAIRFMDLPDEPSLHESAAEPSIPKHLMRFKRGQ